MYRTLKLLPASFKGIPFFVRNEVQTEGGRRLVLHDYPNSNKRYVEDLGQIPNKFSVTAFVTGADFQDNANRLEAALKEKGKGILVMPTFGNSEVYAMPYKMDASQKEVGEIKFDLSFASGTAYPGPEYSTPKEWDVFALGDEVRDKSATFLESLWSNPKETINALSAEYDLDSYAEAVGMLVVALDNGFETETVISLILANSHTLVRDGSLLSNSWVRTLWQHASIGLEGGKAISELLVLAGWGNAEDLGLSEVFGARYPDGLNVADPSGTTAIPLWEPSTAQRIQRNENRLNLVNSGRVNALAIAYEQAAGKDYQTDAEIESVRLQLEEVHNYIMRDDTADRSLIQSQPEVRKAVEDLRIAALAVLDQKEQSKPSLVELDTNVPVGSFVESYMLYAEEFGSADDLIERTKIIRDLNPSLAADKLNGVITVLQT